MPEDATMDIQSTLDLLEDTVLHKPLARAQYLKAIIESLEREDDLSHALLDRLIAICVIALEDKNRPGIIYVLRIINLIQIKIEKGNLAALPHLLPSVQAVINILRSVAYIGNMGTMQSLLFDTFLAFPTYVIIKVAKLNAREIRDVLDTYCHVDKPLALREKVFAMVHKLLKVLQPSERTTFVKALIPTWFSKVIPTIIQSSESLTTLIPFETLEILTDELVKEDYSERNYWLPVLESIYNPQIYPAIMKASLNNGSKTWHRLWIVCIRLLKQQITKTTFSSASPINSMLPVVEMAFKMDVANRCRAFQCWEVLIDNFSTESNETYVVKRLKLLIIPLKSNNAKVEGTAIAKLKTWWHLIYMFQTKLDKFVDLVIIPFLHFCFGKHTGTASPKPSFVPGLMSPVMKKQAVEAFVELAGHLCCGGCVNVPKLNGRIISKKILVDYWNDWVFSLKTAIKIASEAVCLPKQQIECLWKSFVVIVSELPDNNIRRDLFNELLTLLMNLMKNCGTNNYLADIIITLIGSLFQEINIRVLLKPKEEQGPTMQVILFLLDPSFNIFYRRNRTHYIVQKLMPLTNYIMEEKSLTTAILNLDEHQNISFLVTALAESVSQANCDEPQEFTELILWPLRGNLIAEKEYSSEIWMKLISYSWPKLKASTRDKLITAIERDTIPSNFHMRLHMSVAILHSELAIDVSRCEKVVELLATATDAIRDHRYMRDYSKTLVDAIISLIEKIKDGVSFDATKLAENTLLVISNMLKFLRLILEESDKTREDHGTQYVNLLKSAEDLIQKHGSFNLTNIVLELIKCRTLLELQSPLSRNIILNIMKAHLSTDKTDSPTAKSIRNIIDTLESNVTANQENLNNQEFAAPETSTVRKKNKKKEASIVSTVVDDGEEFVVVKSNWKFNPRKLTENQKEKFQRKREDIPALYQDLSQSQDDFRLTTWRADSQEASSSNSKSTTTSISANAGNASEVLKNMPSSDVVPNIIENICSEKKDDDVNVQEKAKEATTKVKKTNTRDPKSPRMALKDRVFRNVRNLIEKSSVQKDGKDLSESLIQVENIPKTPSSKTIDNSNLINSAPPNISTERPSRMKRKPKKFDDVQMFSLKRNRRSTSLNDSQPDLQENVKDADARKETDDAMTISNDSPTTNESNSVTDKNKTNPDQIMTENNINIDRETVTVQEYPNPPSEPGQINKNNCQTKNVNVDLDPKNVVPEPTSELQNEPDVSNKVIKSSDVVPDKEDTTTVGAHQENISNPLSNMVEDSPASDALAVNNDDQNLALTSQDKDESENVELEINKNTKTPKQSKKQEIVEPRSSRKNGVRKSRIEKELAIDTVEGHPFLKIQTEKRMTRKNLNNSVNNSRRKGLTEKLNKSKVESKTPLKTQTGCLKKKDKSPNEIENHASVIVDESQQNCSQVLEDLPLSEDLPFSEDVIESSQDSTFTTISVKPCKTSLKKLTVLVEKTPLVPSTSPPSNKTRQANKEVSIDRTMDLDKDDSVLPQNKTAISDRTEMDLTENMDTQPVDSNVIEDKDSSSDVIIINDDEEPIVVGSETQEIAEADTQTIDSSIFSEITHSVKSISKVSTDMAQNAIQMSNISEVNTEDEVTTTINASVDISKGEPSTSKDASANMSKTADEANTASSPFKNDEQRKQDFLDNTLEISPIKTMSPVRDKKSPSPETSSDYVVIKLSSPVQSNGEPFEKCDSPEIFTEDRVSPDKRDLSPPREENSVGNTSPSSSLSLKKNRPQVRSGGRAAQMLGLCVPDRLQTIKNSERSEPEEPKKNSPTTTPARRNLRILYNSVGGESSETSEENDDSDNFLKFKRTLPTNDCSPSGPILKRKLVEITDDATISPASKRKRVSFHDPPVSTTVSVQKYIEPLGVRSPQNSAIKRLERQNLRSQAILKSPKRLENVFKLDTVLTKAVESFTETEQPTVDLTPSLSLNETPAVEIIKTSDLNDIDPICPDLVDCKDSIDCIAAELSSATMKAMFLKEIEGKLATIGDLARMTELEVNRLCIKAPKIKVAKKVLSDYVSNRAVEDEEPLAVRIEIIDEEISPEVEIVSKMDVEIQTTATVSSDVQMQTIPVALTEADMQTDEKAMDHASVQTNESGAKSTKEVITACLAERADFVEKLSENLENCSRQRIAEKLPFDLMTNVFMDNVSRGNSFELITRLLQKQNESKEQNGNNLSHLQNYLCARFDSKDLILFCSELLAKIHGRPS